MFPFAEFVIENNMKMLSFICLVDYDSELDQDRETALVFEMEL